jgi:hypothetical protein
MVLVGRCVGREWLRLAESTVGEWTGKGKDGREREARQGNQKIPLC